MRQRRLTKKRRRQMKRNLYIKPLVTVYIAFLLLALTVDGTAAKFNDITSVEGAFQVGEWTPDIPWDNSSLTFVKGVKGNCEQITATVKNIGDDMKSPWKYQVHRKAKSDWPRVEDFEGEIELLENKETVEVSFTPEQNGMYRFEFVRPEGYQGNKGGKSGVIKLKDCEEKQSVNMQENNDKDELSKEKKEEERGEGQKDESEKPNDNNSSSTQENNEEQVEEDTESKQDNENNKENDQESEQKSKDQETKEKSTDENTEDSSTDSADDKDDQKKKQQNTKNEQQQESEQEDSAEADSNDDKQQDDQASKSQDSKDDDTQVKEEEPSNDDQNENE